MRQETKKLIEKLKDDKSKIHARDLRLIVGTETSMLSLTITKLKEEIEALEEEIRQLRSYTI